MNSTDNEEHSKLRKALATAYHEKEKAEFDMQWQAKVMAQIRNKEQLYTKTDYLDLFQVVVWRLAPVAGLLLLVLGVAVAQFDFVSDYELAMIIVEDLSDFWSLAVYKI